jgi:F0F1-type ATP synthase membrane subunit c/vacuolar-type H+-ATPase subunit K
VLATILAATSGDVTKAGKAVGLALGVGLTGIQWLGFALTEAVVFYGLLGSILAYVLV